MWFVFAVMASVCPAGTPLLVAVPMSLFFRARGRLVWRALLTWVGSALASFTLVMALAVVLDALDLLAGHADVTTPLLAALGIAAGIAGGIAGFLALPRSREAAPT